MTDPIIIVDYGMGNLGSIRNMLGYLGIPCLITSEMDQIANAKKIIIAGVGAFDYAINKLHEYRLWEVLERKALMEKTPILGICLGMQIMTKKSEEGKQQGFGWIDGETIRFNFNDNLSKLKIPHIGWNTVSVEKESNIITGLDSNSRFYFVHSFHIICYQKKDILLSTNYGYNFPSGIQRENIYGVQFHPEKSHRFGFRLLKSFAEYV